MLGNDVILAIAGNKIDREKDRQVSVATAEAYAKSVNARLYHTSAKLNKGVDELFQELAKRLYPLNMDFFLMFQFSYYFNRNVGKEFIIIVWSTSFWQPTIRIWHSYSTESTNRYFTHRKTRWLLLIISFPCFILSLCRIENQR